MRAKSRFPWMGMIAVTLLTPVLYFFSIGPAYYWMWQNGEDAPELATDVFEIVYAPVMSLGEVPIVGTVLCQYLSLWIDVGYEWTIPVATAGGIPVTPGSGSAGPTEPIERVSGEEVASEEFEFDEATENADESAITPALAVSTTPPPSVRRACQITVPPAGSRPSDVIPVFVAEGDKQQLTEQVDAANPKLRSQGLYLQDNVRLTTPDGRVVIECDRASISHRLVEGSRTEIRDVVLSLEANVRWQGVGFEATAERLYFILVPPGPGTSSHPRITDMQLGGAARITTSGVTGEAKGITLEFEPDAILSVAVPKRVLLTGNGTMSLPGRSGSNGSIEGGRIEYFPQRDLINVDRSESIE